MKNTLKDWCWCIDYSNAVGQKDKKIAPVLCDSRSEARRIANSSFPKGTVRKIKPIQIVK